MRDPVGPFTSRGVAFGVRIVGIEGFASGLDRNLSNVLQERGKLDVLYCALIGRRPTAPVNNCDPWDKFSTMVQGVCFGNLSIHVCLNNNDAANKGS